MHPTGHAAAQSSQPMQRSSPLSYRCRMWRPRWRGDTGFCSSGHCTVMGCVPIFLSVNARPFAISLIIASPSPWLCPERDDRACDDDVDETERKQDLPAEVHEPVVTEPG